MFEVTEDWLKKVSDEEGLTKGQEYLLWKWCLTEPWIGKQIPDQVAHVIGTCRGYRGMAQEIKDLREVSGQTEEPPRVDFAKPKRHNQKDLNF